MDKVELTKKIKEKAKQLGFPLVGITSPEPPGNLNFFRQWLNAGYQASMDWLATERSLERRSDPRAILPECQSILSLGCPYPAPKGNVKGGNIAAYSLNQDYHDILELKLRELMDTIEEWIGGPLANRWYVDTGPLLEKELAMRAGLGWIGKNTMLINKDFGSYFFIAEILLGLELITDPPITETFCGTCTSCLEVCPTGALTDAYTLDANRCISYLTIEHKGEIPLDLRSRMGDWIFGCDICQIICPWNKRKHGEEGPPILEALQPREDLLDIDLIEELQLEQAAFSAKFKGSPVKRTKRRGYLRNVVIALGNRGEADSLPALERALEDQEPDIQSHARWAIKMINKNMNVD